MMKRSGILALITFIDLLFISTNLNKLLLKGLQQNNAVITKTFSYNDIHKYIYAIILLDVYFYHTKEKVLLFRIT